MSDWRTYGDVSPAIFRQTLRDAGSDLDADACYATALGFTALCLAMLGRESRYWTRFNQNDKASNNPLNLRPPDGDGYARYARPEDGVRAWRERITSRTYKGGIYADTTTLAELIHVYAPSSDNNDEAGYVRFITDAFASWGVVPKEAPMADITYGNVDRPTIIEMIVSKPYEGAGFTRVPARRCFGACDHITDGDASLEWYHDFFGTGGQRQNDALTDFGIDKAGRIAMWNDPFGTRSPWASGGSDGLEGDGPLFVRTLGIGGINGAIASTEHVGRSPAKMTDAQLEASARLKAWIFDGASNHPRGSKVPWSSFPLNPNVGCVTHVQHWEFATKPCPGPGIRGQTDALQNRIRALMKQAQEGESQGEIPPPEPVEPDHDRLPAGIDWDIVAERFGVGELHRAGKAPGHFTFHRGRAWSEAYIARAAEQKEWPAVLGWNQYEDAPDRTREIITFANGWLLLRLNAREGWKWA